MKLFGNGFAEGENDGYRSAQSTLRCRQSFKNCLTHDGGQGFLIAEQPPRWGRDTFMAVFHAGNGKVRIEPKTTIQ